MDGMTFVTSSSQQLLVMNPFGDAEAVSVDLTRSVNVTQLADEIGRLAGFPVMLVVIRDAVSAGEKLYITPVVAETVIVQAVNDHEIDDLYGLDDVQRERRELVAKLKSDTEMTAAEIRRALRLALSPD